MENKAVRILFVGNSHTYFNDMPLMVQKRFQQAGIDCLVTMIAHGGWYLEQHVNEPDVRFNILFGGYDFVVLQEYAHPFGPEEKYLTAAKALSEWIRQAGSVPVIYETWAQKSEPEIQERMNEAHRMVAREIGALLAPVGETWWKTAESCPGTDLYYTDGAHASPAGSELAAGVIFETIRENLFEK